jgi:hypothetical protein
MISRVKGQIWSHDAAARHNQIHFAFGRIILRKDIAPKMKNRRKASYKVGFDAFLFQNLWLK